MDGGERSVKRLMVIGGFLGAGKTTVILALARLLAGEGRRVAVVTNDRGTALVDTLYLQSQGLPAYGLGGGCFCTQLENFHAVLQTIDEAEHPDVVLCEPIGSSIDLLDKLLGGVAQAFPEGLAIAPLTVVVDPVRLGNWLRRRGTDGATHLDYVFEKQMEQADVLFLNKTDALQQEQIATLAAALAEALPGKELLTGAAARGAGVEELLAALNRRDWASWTLPLDLAQHKQAERELGWFGLTYEVAGVRSLRKLLQEAGRQIALQFPNRDVAHVKFVALDGQGGLKASMTDDSGTVRFSTPNDRTGDFRLIASARVQGEAAQVRRVVSGALEVACRRQKAACRPVRSAE